MFQAQWAWSWSKNLTVMTSQSCCQGIMYKTLIQTGQDNHSDSFLKKQCCWWSNRQKGKLFWKLITCSGCWINNQSHLQRETETNEKERDGKGKRKLTDGKRKMGWVIQPAICIHLKRTGENRLTGTDRKADASKKAEQRVWRWKADRKSLFKCCPALVNSQSCCQGEVFCATPAQWVFVTRVLRGAQRCSSWPVPSQAFSCQDTDNQAQWGVLDAGEFWACFLS